MEIRDRLYIGGAWVVPVRADTIEVLDSTTEEVIGSVPSGTAEDARSRAVRGGTRRIRRMGTDPAVPNGRSTPRA